MSRAHHRPHTTNAKAANAKSKPSRTKSSRAKPKTSKAIESKRSRTTIDAWSGRPRKPDNRRRRRQPLRDVTEQDNFESFLAKGDEDEVPGPEQLGVASQSALHAAGQEPEVLPESSAIGVSQRETELEPAADRVDLLDDTTREASLFDQPTEDGEIVSPDVRADERETLRARQVDERDHEEELQRVRQDKSRRRRNPNPKSKYATQRIANCIRER